MRILYYSTSYHANHGGSIQSIEFYNCIEKVSLRNEKFLFPLKGKVLKFQDRRNTNIKSLLKKNPFLQVISFYRRNLFHVNGLIRKIEEVKPEVIIIQIDSNFLQIKKIKDKFPDLVICTQINGSPFDEQYKNIAFKRYFLKLQREAYILANLNFFISEFSRDRIMGNRFNNERDFVIHNGTNTEKFFPIPDKDDLRDDYKYPKGKFIIGYVGTLDFHKHLQILVEAFAELLPDFPFLYLVIIGDGPAYDKIKSNIINLNIQDNVCLKGWVRHEDINLHLNCFNLAVHHYANSYMNPLKIFEYLSVGLPVIGPDIPSVNNAFQHRKDLLITGPSKLDLKENIKEIIENKELRSSLSNNSHLIEEIKEKYTWSRYTRRIINLIDSKIK
jgi:glycosyltransferase involved in cell wall biosynthesis